jgi:hypothetical protein
MSITSNLLYLLLLYAVLDKSGKLNVTTGILIALGIMLFSFCCGNLRVVNNNSCCCGNRTVTPFILSNGL